VNPTKHHLPRTPLSDINRNKQAVKHGLTPVGKSSSSRIDTPCPYFDRVPLSHIDPYHDNRYDWNKENYSNQNFHPYFDCRAGNLPSFYYSSFHCSSANLPAFYRPPTASFSSLDVYRQRDLLSRPEQASTSSVNTSPELPTARKRPRDQSEDNNRGSISQCSSSDIEMGVLIDISNDTTDLTKPTPFTPPRDDIRTPNFTMQASGEFYGYAYKQQVTPERRKIMEQETGSPPLKRVKYNDNGSPIKAYKQNGDEWEELEPSMITGDLRTFASGGKLKPNDVYIKANRSDVIPEFDEFTQFSGATVVTKEEVDFWEGKRQGYKPPQGQSMAYWSATQLAELAGVTTTGAYHHTHLIRFGFVNVDGKPNDVQNLIVAAAGANFRHLQVEDAAKSLVTEHGSIVIEYDIPQDQEIFDPVFHLFGIVNYRIYEAKPERLADYRAGRIGTDQVKGALLKSFVIESLNPNLPRTTDQKYIRANAYANKLRAHGFTSTDNYRPADLPPVNRKLEL
jgi:hypothetical protein